MASNQLLSGDESRLHGNCGWCPSEHNHASSQCECYTDERQPGFHDLPLHGPMSGGLCRHGDGYGDGYGLGDG